MTKPYTKSPQRSKTYPQLWHLLVEVMSFVYYIWMWPKTGTWSIYCSKQWEWSKWKQGYMEMFSSAPAWTFSQCASGIPLQWCLFPLEWQKGSVWEQEIQLGMFWRFWHLGRSLNLCICAFFWTPYCKLAKKLKQIIVPQKWIGWEYCTFKLGIGNLNLLSPTQVTSSSIVLLSIQKGQHFHIDPQITVAIWQRSFCSLS